MRLVPLNPQLNSRKLLCEECLIQIIVRHDVTAAQTCMVLNYSEDRRCFQYILPNPEAQQTMNEACKIPNRLPPFASAMVAELLAPCYIEPV